MEKAGSAKETRYGRSFAPFDKELPAVFRVLVEWLLKYGVKSKEVLQPGAANSEVTLLKNTIQQSVLRTNTFSLRKEDCSVPIASALLDKYFSALPDPVVPYSHFNCVTLSVAQGHEKDKLRYLRRVLATIPPGNRLFLEKTSQLISALRSKSRSNKVTHSKMCEVFSFALCRDYNDHKSSDVSNSLVDLMGRNHDYLFSAKKVAKLEKDGDLSVPFISSLQEACMALGGELLPRILEEDQYLAEQKKKMRSSRRSVKGWDDVFTILKEDSIPASGLLNKRAPALRSPQEKRIAVLGPEAKELGKLFFNMKIHAARQYFLQKMAAREEEAAQKRQKEQQQQRQEAAEAATRSAERTKKQLSLSEGEYEGEVNEAGRADGKGELRYKNGDVYVGEFCDGSATGSGELTLPDASKYVGMVKDGKPHGFGKFTYPNGDWYEGEFENDCYSGKGKYVSPESGTEYEGDFLDGMRNGRGRFKTAKGHEYFGEYVNDVMHGIGIYSYANGDEYKGMFANGKFNGKGIYSFQAGKSVEGIFEDGQYVGPDPDAVLEEDEVEGGGGE